MEKLQEKKLKKLIIGLKIKQLKQLTLIKDLKLKELILKKEQIQLQ